jgi:hypothetical protein
MSAGAGMAALGALLVQFWHPAPDQPDPYEGLTQPNSTISCCGGQDCRPALPCRTTTGADGWMVGDRCYELLPSRRILPPPDFWNDVEHPLHVCWKMTEEGPQIYCWMRADTT